MAINTFAAIKVGSYEVSMKIYELSKKNGIREVDYLRYRMELGRDAYAQGKIGREMLDELCEVLKAYVTTMAGYQVSAYRACATSAIRELKNPHILIEQIFRRTGINIEILSNSEQRFLSYESVASTAGEFEETIKKGTAILDVGGGSVQISLFDKGALVTTENLKLGILRIRERLKELEKETIHYECLVEEFIHNELLGFKRLYLKEWDIEQVILLGDFFTDAIFHGKQIQNRMTAKELDAHYAKMIHATPEQLSDEMEIPMEYASLVMPTIVLYKSFMDVFEAESMWAPGTMLIDGMAYDYGEKNRFIKTTHNFENDMLTAARNISRRYNCSRSHTKAVMDFGMAIFDGMKRIHGLGNRERLLLQLAVLLHDCGKYISVGNVAQCSYNIIMSTEIIGLSEQEREVIAHVVKYNTQEFDYFQAMKKESAIDKSNYLLVAKLTAILRLANALDRSHYQKIEAMQVTVRDQQLILTVTSKDDLLLERGLMKNKADFFEEVYSIRPVIKRKRIR